LYSIGFMSQQVTFYTVELVGKDLADKGAAAEFIYQLGAYETVHTRNVYTFLDWSSSIGGLLEALEFCGSFLMFISTLFSGSGLDRYLVANLFKTSPKKEDRKQQYEQNKIASRKPAIFSICNCLCRWKDSISAQTYAVAEGRMSSELDIVSFIRHQMIGKLSQRMLFSNMERYLIRN